jgi:HK97 family phage prohead protease
VATAPNLIHKTLGVDAVVLDEEHGIVEAYVSGIGNKDSVGDIILPGAFDTYLKVRKPKGVWSHDWDRPVSKTLEIREVAAGSPDLPMKMQLAGIGGLYVKTQFNLATKEGRDAFENVKFFGEEAEWSIGYQVHDQEYDKSKKANLLKTIELYEYSPVLFGANNLTSTVSIKADRNADGEIECKIEGLDEIQTRAVKAALEVVLKEKDATVENDAQEEQNMSMQKNEATGLYELELEDGEIKSFRSEEKAEAFLADCKAYADAVEAAEKADDEEVVEKSEEGEVDGEKSVVGSMEERAEKLMEAIRAAAGDNAYAKIEATFESSVIYEVYDYATGSETYYQASYTMDEEGEVKLGEPTEVELVEVVVAKTALQEAVKADMVQEVKDAIADLPELAEIAEIMAKTAAVVDTKAGRVLSTKNRSNLENALKAIQDVLDTDATEDVTEEKSDAEVAIERIEAHVKGGLISEEDAEVMLKAIQVKDAELGLDPETGETDELAELRGYSQEDLDGMKAWAEALEAKGDEAEEIEVKTEEEEDVELDALKDLSDDELEAVKEWAAAVEAETKSDDEDPEEEADDDVEGEKSEDSDLLSAKAELDALSELLGE